jgi:hypothetical protein
LRSTVAVMYYLYVSSTPGLYLASSPVFCSTYVACILGTLLWYKLSWTVLQARFILTATKHLHKANDKGGTVTLRFGFELRRIANWALLLELPTPAKLAIRKGNLLYVLKQHGIIITQHTMQQVWYVKPLSCC